MTFLTNRIMRTMTVVAIAAAALVGGVATAPAAHANHTMRLCLPLANGGVKCFDIPLEYDPTPEPECMCPYLVKIILDDRDWAKVDTVGQEVLTGLGELVRAKGTPDGDLASRMRASALASLNRAAAFASQTQFKLASVSQTLGAASSSEVDNAVLSGLATLQRADATTDLRTAAWLDQQAANQFDQAAGLIVKY